MPASQQQLDLKDIHLPDTIAWWPPAIGYWIIIACILSGIAIFFAIKTYRKRTAIKRLALKEFNLIHKNYITNSNKKQLVTALSELLRRAAISTYPLSDCAGLTGQEWLHWLDKQLTKSTLTFTDGSGHLLTDFIYSSSQEPNNVDDLIKLSQQWLKKLPPAQDRNQ